MNFYKSEQYQEKERLFKKINYYLKSILVICYAEQLFKHEPIEPSICCSIWCFSVINLSLCQLDCYPHNP